MQGFLAAYSVPVLLALLGFVAGRYRALRLKTRREQWDFALVLGLVATDDPVIRLPEQPATFGDAVFRRGWAFSGFGGVFGGWLAQLASAVFRTSPAFNPTTHYERGVEVPRRAAMRTARSEFEDLVTRQRR